MQDYRPNDKGKVESGIKYVKQTTLWDGHLKMVMI